MFGLRRLKFAPQSRATFVILLGIIVIFSWKYERHESPSYFKVFDAWLKMKRESKSYEIEFDFEQVDSSTNVLILSTWRTGAGAFLAQFLNQYPKTFYAQDPLQILRQEHVRNCPF